MSRPARLAMVTVAGVVGAYVGFWFSCLGGWSGDARWPLDPGGGALMILLVVTVAAAAALIGGVVLGVTPIVPYRRVAKEGRQTTATVVEAWRTGGTTHSMGEILSEFGFVLEVRPRDGPSYRARTKKMIATGDEAFYRPGTALQVRYHPKTPRRVFVVGTITDTHWDRYSRPPR